MNYDEDVSPILESSAADADAVRKPSPLELVDLARITVKPGDKLLIKPKDTDLPPEYYKELAAHLRVAFAPHLPGVGILLLPLAADVAVIEGSGAPTPQKPEPSPLDAQPWSVWTAGGSWWVFHAPSGQFLPVVRDALEGSDPRRLARLGARPLSSGGVAGV